MKIVKKKLYFVFVAKTLIQIFFYTTVPTKRIKKTFPVRYFHPFSACLSPQTLSKTTFLWRWKFWLFFFFFQFFPWGYLTYSTESNYILRYVLRSTKNISFWMLNGTWKIYELLRISSSIHTTCRRLLRRVTQIRSKLKNEQRFCILYHGAPLNSSFPARYINVPIAQRGWFWTKKVQKNIHKFEKIIKIGHKFQYG